MLIALTTGHKIGLITAAAIFVVFALLTAVVIPHFRPRFPGRGLPLFVVACVLLFVGMMTAVLVFGRESGEAKGESGPATTTSTTTTTSAAATKVAVQETEFKIALPSTTLKAGAYEFDVKNAGSLPHDLAIQGSGVDTKSPLIAAGQSAVLKVTLKPGTYDFYCSVPGHKDAGMDAKVTVS